ncbi:hypothetical protein GGU11DRAFT_688575 [Lentinula aff. detonsa]|nr:hypothetical protein GGU11DRAFT_688575 [Lentinula aff. detonsa]
MGTSSGSGFQAGRRVASESKESSSRDIQHDSSSADSGWGGIGAFSDEYDLYPKILQDVQRALKLKQRREARRKSGYPSGSPSDRPSSPLRSSILPESSNGISHLGHSLPTATSIPSTSVPTAPLTTDIDFSPSTGLSTSQRRRRLLHPIPLSSDGGKTLDWSGSGFGDEDEKGERTDSKGDKRWSLKREKEKERELALLLPNAEESKRQEEEYIVKLSRIKTLSSQSTSKKVAITADQLGRRYSLIYNSFGFNLLQVSKWYAGQDKLVRSSLENAEPFIWLKHLEKRKHHAEGGELVDVHKDDGNHTTATTSRPPWHLSALIMEEYVHAQNAKDRPQVNLPPPAQINPIRPMGSIPEHPLSPLDEQSQLPAHPFIIPSGYSTPSAPSAYSPPSIYSNSTYSPPSTYSAPSAPYSPNHNSPYPQFDSNSRYSPQQSQAQIEAGRISFEPILEPLSVLTSASTAQEHHSSRYLQPPSAARPSNESRRSLESTGTKEELAMEMKRRQEREERREAEEAREDMEYELKAQLVASCKDSNTHIRSVLNHIAQRMREYEVCQQSFRENHHPGLEDRSDLSNLTLPHELLEAFSHDPANVTSSTKRLKSYRAVDDIHHRLMKQRAVFREFLDQNQTSNGTRSDADDEDILQDPIDSLLRTLKELEDHRMRIVDKEKEVSEMLRETQIVHAEVKKVYNDTLVHTSVVYPELSQITGLEESYRDQYQHLWDLGMSFLTLLLDTITPFWRTYGKVIGDDVQDFLIIPLYRHEFTGESKRYPIRRVPKRSVRHWIGLMLLFVGSVGLVVVQGRAAVESGSGLGLRWARWGMVIPVWWMIILGQWCAVIGELAVVLMQVGMMLWWFGWAVRVLD